MEQLEEYLSHVDIRVLDIIIDVLKETPTRNCLKVLDRIVDFKMNLENNKRSLAPHLYKSPSNSMQRFTFVISGTTSIDCNMIRSVMNSIGGVETTIEDVMTSSIASKTDATPYIDIVFAYQLKLSNGKGWIYDKRLYDINCLVKNMLGDNREMISSKNKLYSNMVQTFPNIARRHFAETWNLKDIQRPALLSDIYKRYPNTVLIIKPGSEVGGGDGIYIASNIEEFRSIKNTIEKHKATVKKHKNLTIDNYIVSRYISNPMLWYYRGSRHKDAVYYDNGRSGFKFHLRIYYMVINIDGDIRFSIFKKGKILTARLPYRFSDFDNKDIHDTHLDSTFNFYEYPKEMHDTELCKDIDAQIYNILDHTTRMYGPFAKTFTESRYGYQVFGCDFMVENVVKEHQTVKDVTECKNVILLEINNKVGYCNIVDGITDFGDNGHTIEYSNFFKEMFEWVSEEAIVPMLNHSKK